MVQVIESAEATQTKYGITSEQFSTHIADVFARTHRLDRSRVKFFENSVKYDRDGADSTASEILTKLIGVNRLGVETTDLCRSRNGLGQSFREAMEAAAQDLAKRVAGERVIYIELGPEPVKTRHLLSSLATACQSVTYLGIDINATSQPIMREMVNSVLGEGNFNFALKNYKDIDVQWVSDKLNNQHIPKARIILTSLGWQEGNEHPGLIHRIYTKLTRPGDLVLSEMQILPVGDHYPIHAFWNQPIWRDASELFCQKVFGARQLEFGTVLFPVEIDPFGNVMCAVTTETHMGRAPETEIYLSNYCLKFSRQQLQDARKHFGFTVLCEQTTGDGSVTFHTLARQSA